MSQSHSPQITTCRESSQQTRYQKYVFIHWQVSEKKRKYLQWKYYSSFQRLWCDFNPQQIIKLFLYSEQAKGWFNNKHHKRCCKQTFFVHLLYQHTFHGFLWLLSRTSLSILPAAVYTLCPLSREVAPKPSGFWLGSAPGMPCAELRGRRQGDGVSQLLPWGLAAVGCNP